MPSIWLRQASLASIIPLRLGPSKCGTSAVDSRGRRAELLQWPTEDPELAPESSVALSMPTHRPCPSQRLPLLLALRDRLGVLLRLTLAVDFRILAIIGSSPGVRMSLSSWGGGCWVCAVVAGDSLL